MLTFTLDPAESVNARVARVALEAVSTGPMGCWLQRERYASFLDIWNMSDDYSRLLDKLHAGAVLAGVKTSCAVDASAVLGYCGQRLKKPWRADGSWGITSWLGLSFQHAAWVDAKDKKGNRREIPLGGVFYRGGKTSPLGHVGIFAAPVGLDKWITVEGGGSLKLTDMAGLTQSQIKATNGTVMRASSADGKDPWELDSLGRGLTGWWDTARIGLPTWEEIIERAREVNNG